MNFCVKRKIYHLQAKDHPIWINLVHEISKKKTGGVYLHSPPKK